MESTGATSKKTTAKETIKAFKKRMKEKQEKDKKEKDEIEMADLLLDEYELAMNCGKDVRKETGLVYDDRMALHKCEWDPEYPENPDRYMSIMKVLEEHDLINRCKQIMIETFPVETITKLHSVMQLVNCKKASEIMDIETAEVFSSNYDAVYFNNETYGCALLACNATLSLVRAIAHGEVQNGLAVVRPPGHHAQRNNFNGYCILNNVAIAANYLLEKAMMHKILIVDFDVHHGQGTQQMFYNNPKVLYFSIHRYENGTFWPNLRESSFDAIGMDAGAGYNVNVPLNTTHCTDTDYMAIVLNLLLPIAYEFQPDFILFSAGYDACLGCPEGEMAVTPGFYGHLIRLLSGLANGRLAVILEGGYFLPSLAQGVSSSLQALLDDEPPVLQAMGEPCASVIETINNVKYTLHNYWECFKVFQLYNNTEAAELKEPIHCIKNEYLGEPSPPPYPTRDCYPVESHAVFSYYKHALLKYMNDYGPAVRNTVCFAYDAEMEGHRNIGSESLEGPRRLKLVYERFKELQLDSRCSLVETSMLDLFYHAKQVHGAEYINELFSDNFTLPDNSTDMYWHQTGSSAAILVALQTILSVTDHVMRGMYSSGTALIRPPGHHANASNSMGFCFVNNVAVAAQYAIDVHGAKRVLIVDFDIHHGNGTQEIFYGSNKVLYLSIHKYEHGLFFPGRRTAGTSSVGAGYGEGYNVNVPFSMERMGNTEYMQAFFRVVLPIGYAYAPDLVIVSAGFDAGIHDLLGNYLVTPEAFGHMIQLLRPLAGGKLVVAMEGGYNYNTLKHSLCFCVKALLGDPLPKLKIKAPSKYAHRSFQEVIATHKKYWPLLGVDRPLPSAPPLIFVTVPDQSSGDNVPDVLREMAINDVIRYMSQTTIFHN